MTVKRVINHSDILYLMNSIILNFIFLNSQLNLFKQTSFFFFFPCNQFFKRFLCLLFWKHMRKLYMWRSWCTPYITLNTLHGQSTIRFPSSRSSWRKFRITPWLHNNYDANIFVQTPHQVKPKETNNTSLSSTWRLN